MAGSTTTPRGPVTHKARAWPEVYRAFRDGHRKHDLRHRDDPDFRVDDLILQQEFDPRSRTYTGEEVLMRITYITSVDNACALSPEGLSPDHAILSVELVRDAERDAA